MNKHIVQVKVFYADEVVATENYSEPVYRDSVMTVGSLLMSRLVSESLERSLDASELVEEALERKGKVD